MIETTKINPVEIDTKIVDAQGNELVPVRHGYWVLGKELSREYIGDVCVSIHYDKCWCSECDYPVEEYPFWMYCPNCGAKMDGATNSPSPNPDPNEKSGRDTEE